MKAFLKRAATWLDALSSRERLLVFGASVGVLFLFVMMSSIDPSMARVAVPDYVHFGVIETFRLFVAMTEFPALAALTRFPAPLLAVLGVRDPLLPKASRVREVVSLLPDHVDVVVLRDAAHAINYSHPHELSTIIRAYLADAPLVQLVPAEAATPALFFVGFLMMSQVVHVNWEDPEEGIPAFLTIVLMPFTYSITTGIGAGFIAFALIKAIRGKSKDVHPLMWGVAAAFVLYFAQGIITSLIG